MTLGCNKSTIIKKVWTTAMLNIIAFSIISFFSISAFSTSIILSSKTSITIWDSIQGKYTSQRFGIHINDTQLQTDSVGDISLYFDNPLGSTFLKLSFAQRAIFRAHIKKYKKWNAKADKMGVELQKEIGKLEAHDSGFAIDKSIYTQHTALKIAVSFYSMRKGKHTLRLSFGKITSSKNKYSSHTHNDIYLTWKQVNTLERVISETNILKVAREKLKKKKDISSEFK
jgi:hypothetical protein